MVAQLIAAVKEPGVDKVTAVYCFDSPVYDKC